MCERLRVKNIAIKVNNENERIIIRFRGGFLYTEDAFDHELCPGGRVVICRVSRTHGVLFCKTCKLRVHIPMPQDKRPNELAEQDIMAYFRNRFNEELEVKPCRLCGKFDSIDCSVCNPALPKNKVSGK